MSKITLAEVQYIAFKLAKKFLSYNEPIPDFQSRFPNILESCLAVPFQKFNKKDLYPGLIKKASILFYLMIKNHPFQNGNKRIAITTLLVFLYKNHRWLKIDSYELYKFAVDVAKSRSEDKDLILKGIEQFIRTYLVKLK
jgi:death-on-curing family protein